jgi:hypothetical protein
VDKSKRPGGKCERPAWFLDLAGVGPNANPMTPKIQNIDGILWAQPSQDYSSSGTGSSIFDFNGDGKPEVVYRDECYLRVYDGPTGRVVYSAPGASGTGYEYPVIVDADGDFSTEIVVPRAKPVAGASPEKCAPTDPLFAGGVSKFEYKAGFVVLRDPQDRWVPSRPIWNQHAYSVTHVNDDGTVPRSSQTKRNWEQKGSSTEPALNNFRQNVQGSLAKVGLADLTATVGNIANLCNGQAGETPFQARVCNRGTNPVGDGVEIAFYTWAQGDGGTFSPTAPGASRICEVRTPRLLDVGDCVTVQCTGMLPAFRDVFVAVDPSGTVADCKPNNNNGVSARLSCPK